MTVNISFSVQVFSFPGSSIPKNIEPTILEIWSTPLDIHSVGLNTTNICTELAPSFTDSSTPGKMNIPLLFAAFFNALYCS